MENIESFQYIAQVTFKLFTTSSKRNSHFVQQDSFQNIRKNSLNLQILTWFDQNKSKIGKKSKGKKNELKFTPKSQLTETALKKN